MTFTNEGKITDQYSHEEYATLLRLTAPGTTRQFRNHKSSSTIKRMDVIMADSMLDTRPSGIVLPKILRKKLLLQEQERQKRNEMDENDEKDNNDNDVALTSVGDTDGSDGATDAMKDVIPEQVTSVRNMDMDMDINKNIESTILEKMDQMERMTLAERIAQYDMNGNFIFKHSSVGPNTTNDNIALTPSNSGIHSSNYPEQKHHEKQLLQHENELIEEQINNIQNYLPDNYTPPPSYQQQLLSSPSSNNISSRSFTTIELERKIAQANHALINIQKQLTRGEELYHQETDAHGNIYKGWESFIDVKSEHLGIPNYDIGSSNDPSEYQKDGGINGSSGGSNHPPVRRMNNDMRWFSLSSILTDSGSFSSSVDIGNDNKAERKRQRRSLISTSSLSTCSSIRSMNNNNNHYSGSSSRASSSLSLSKDDNSKKRKLNSSPLRKTPLTVPSSSSIMTHVGNNEDNTIDKTEKDEIKVKDEEIDDEESLRPSDKDSKLPTFTTTVITTSTSNSIEEKTSQNVQLEDKLLSNDDEGKNADISPNQQIPKKKQEDPPSFQEEMQKLNDKELQQQQQLQGLAADQNNTKNVGDIEVEGDDDSEGEGNDGEKSKNGDNKSPSKEMQSSKKRNFEVLTADDSSQDKSASEISPKTKGRPRKRKKQG